MYNVALSWLCRLLKVHEPLLRPYFTGFFETLYLLTLQQQRKRSKGMAEIKNSHLHPNVGITTSAMLISIHEPRDHDNCKEKENDPEK